MDIIKITSAKKWYNTKRKTTQQQLRKQPKQYDVTTHDLLIFSR